MKRFEIVVPMSASEEDPAEALDDVVVLDNLLEEMDDDAGSEGEPEPEPEDDPAPAPVKPVVQDKTNFAFGKLRTENKAMAEILEKVAKAQGLEYNGLEDLLPKLKEDSFDKLSKKQGVPVELLKELDELRQDRLVYREQAAQISAENGFKTLMEEHDLTVEELQAFATELDSKGLNPFVKHDVNIVEQYKILHYDEVMQKKIDKAVQEALSKSNAADSHSSTPSSKKGKPPVSEEPITTLKGLNDLLDKM